LSDSPRPKPPAELGQKTLQREQLLARLRDVTEQRDKLLSQYEAMALQVDESTREIDDALLDARRRAQEAEKSERFAQQEAAQIKALTRQLEEERRNHAAVSAEYARYREATRRAPIDDPWGVSRRAFSQILADWIAVLRAKIPRESPFLPWFDRAIDLVQASARLVWRCAKAAYSWVKPRAIAISQRLKVEIAQRLSKR